MFRTCGSCCKIAGKEMFNGLQDAEESREEGSREEEVVDIPYRKNRASAVSPGRHSPLSALVSLLLFLLASVVCAGGPDYPRGPLEVAGPANPWRFIKAVGERSGLWGFENGRLEAWVYPLKIFHDFHLTFQVEGVPREYPGDEVVRSVRVYPHMVQLTYAAERFRVVQTLFAPRHGRATSRVMAPTSGHVA